MPQLVNTADLFRLLDTDHNGRLTGAEVPAWAICGEKPAKISLTEQQFHDRVEVMTRGDTASTFPDYHLTRASQINGQDDDAGRLEWEKHYLPPISFGDRLASFFSGLTACALALVSSVLLFPALLIPSCADTVGAIFSDGGARIAHAFSASPRQRAATEERQLRKEVLTSFSCPSLSPPAPASPAGVKVP